MILERTKGVDDIFEDRSLLIDITQSLLGRQIGSGASRVVYENAQDKDEVIKIEYMTQGDNWLEHRVWTQAKEFGKDLKWAKKWFAPVNWISPDGRILCMERTEEKPNKKRPKKVPDFFCDAKYENFGWYKGRLVCHDYAIIWRMMKTPTKKMQKVEW